MYAFADIMEYIDDKEPQKLASGIFTYIYIILYYYSYYKIEYEIVEKEKTVKEKVNYSKKGKNHRKPNVTTVIVPRKVVRMSSERALSARKRSKPLYSVKSWTRATHIRRYRDKNGKVIKEIVIKESVCNRRKDLVQSVSDENSTQSKKIFKIDDESIKKAKKQ